MGADDQGSTVLRLANSDQFRRLYMGGVLIREIAKQMRVSCKTVMRAISVAGLPRRGPDGGRGDAPTTEDAEASLAGLALAPSVYRAAEKFRRQYDERKANESQGTTYSRIYRLTYGR